MSHSRGMHELTYKSHGIGDARPCNGEIDQLPNEPLVEANIFNKFTTLYIRSKVNINWGPNGFRCKLLGLFEKVHCIFSLRNKNSPF